MPRSPTLALVGLLLAAVACTPDPPAIDVPSGSSRPHVFDRAWVKLKVQTQLESGGQVDVHFLVPNATIDPLAAAEDCVIDFTQPGQFRSAFCFAYTDARDFTYAKVNDKTGVTKNLCWRAAYAKAFDGATLGDRNPAYAKAGCPSAKASAG